MNRGDFHRLAAEYVAEAKTLLDAGHFGAAYYLAGYAVECGLKACICRGIGQHEFPRSRDFSRECFDHNLKKLVTVAELDKALAKDIAANKILGRSWQTVGGWSEQTRYNRRGETEARSLYDAITDPADGVLSWVKMYW